MSRAAPLSIPPLVRNVLTAERLLARVSRGRAFAWDDSSTSGRATSGDDTSAQGFRSYGARRSEFSRALLGLADTGLGAEACTMLRVAHAASVPVTHEAAFATIVAAAASGGLALSAADAAQLAGLGEVAEFAPADVESLGLAYLSAGDSLGAIRAVSELARAGEMKRAASTLDRVVNIALQGPAPVVGGTSSALKRASTCRTLVGTLIVGARDEKALAGPLLWDAAVHLALRSHDKRDNTAAKQLWAALVSVADVAAARCVKRGQARRGCVSVENDTALAAAIVSMPLHAAAYEGVMRAAAVRGDAQTTAAALGHWASALEAPPPSTALRAAFFAANVPFATTPPSAALIFLAARTLAEKGDWTGAIDAVKLYTRTSLVSGSGEGGNASLPLSLLGNDARMTRRIERVFEIAMQLDARGIARSEPLLFDVAWPSAPGPSAIDALPMENLALLIPPSETDSTKSFLDVSLSAPLLSPSEFGALVSSRADTCIIDLAIRSMSALGCHTQIRSLWDAGVGIRFLDTLRSSSMNTSSSLDSTSRNGDLFKATNETDTSPMTVTATTLPLPFTCFPQVVDAFTADDNDAATYRVITSILDAKPPLDHNHTRLLTGIARWLSRAKVSLTATEEVDLITQTQRTCLLERLIAEAPVTAGGQDGVSLEIANAVVAVHSPARWRTLPPPTLFATEARAHETLDLSYTLRIDAHALPSTLVERFEAMRARGLTVPPETALRAAVSILGFDETALSPSTTSVSWSASNEAANWVAKRSIHDGVDAFGAALSTLAALSPPGNSSTPPVTLAIEDARAYEVLIEAGLALADGVALSLGPGNHVPLSPLEATLREGVGRVALTAGYVGHAKALLARDVCSPRRALRGLISPLLRRTTLDADQETRLHALRLLTVAADVMTSYGTTTDPASMWTRIDLESFYMASASVVDFATPSSSSSSSSSGSRASAYNINTIRGGTSHGGNHVVRPTAAAVTARVINHLLDTRRSEPTTLAVTPNALWTLVSTLAHCDAHSWALPRVLSAVSVGTPRLDSLTASPIVVSDTMAASAVLAAARMRFIDSAHSAWHDPISFSGTVTDFLWHAAQPYEQIALGPRPGMPHIPWTQLLLVRSNDTPSAGILAALPVPTPSLLADGRVLRAIPSSSSPPPPPPSQDSAFVTPPPTLLTTATSAFGDIITPIIGGGAFLMSPMAVAAALQRAGRSGNDNTAAVRILGREMMRLGAWFTPTSARELARAALHAPALLPPLLLHLQAQAVALLSVVPDSRPMLLRLARSLPVTGTGVDAQTLAVLIDAAVAGGLLTVALQLLETAPVGWRLPPTVADRLIRLAQEEGETAVIAEVLRSYLPSPRIFRNSKSSYTVSVEEENNNNTVASSYDVGSHLVSLAGGSSGSTSSNIVHQELR